MEFRQLRYFVVLAEELGFTRAAARLHVSQPPLSFQIGKLEAELGARLFNRTSRTVELSDAGKAFLPHALAMLERVEEARSRVALVASGREGRVNLGLSGSHFLGPLPRFIGQFGARRPGVEIVLHEMRPVDSVRALRDGRLDLAISRGTSADAQVRSRLLWRDPVVAALPHSHRLAGRKSIRLAELQADAFVFLRLDSSLFARRLFDACVAAGFAPRIVQQVVELPALVPVSMARLRADAVAFGKLSRGVTGGDVVALTRTDEPQAVVREFAMALLDWAGTLPRPAWASP